MAVFSITHLGYSPSEEYKKVLVRTFGVQVVVNDSLAACVETVLSDVLGGHKVDGLFGGSGNHFP